MTKFSLPPPEPITFLGRSPLLDDSGVRGVWDRMTSSRFFQKERTKGDFYEYTVWYVDQLPSVHAFTAGSVTGDTIPEEQEWGYEKAWSILQLESWMRTVSLSGKIETRFGGTPADVAISIYLFDPATCSEMFGNFFAQCRLSNLRDGLSTEETMEFHRRVHQALGLGSAIEITRNGNTLGFRLHQRVTDGKRVMDIGTCRENSGPLEGGTAVGVSDELTLRRTVDAVLEQWPVSRIHWQRVHLEVEGGSAWEEARPWMAAHHDGVWKLGHTLTAREVWTPEKFQTRDPSIDLIPVGRLRFPRRGTTASTLPKPLQGMHLLVDLFKEGSGWHFAYHFLEDQFGRIKRENMRKALNSFMGFDLVTRTAETLWPAAFPS